MNAIARSYTIREGTEADLDALAIMGESFFPAVGYDKHFAASSERMIRLGRAILGLGLLLVAVDGQGVPCGMFGMLIYDHPMAEARCATEMFWWTEPSARGSLGLRLLHRAEAWAREHGATHLMMVAPNEEVEALYQRLQFERVETTYIRRLT